MFVRELMIQDVAIVSPDMSINKALELMDQKRIRHLPVLDETRRLVGFVSRQSLVSATPSASAALSSWEVKYVLNKLKIKDVMKTDLLTVSPDAPLEEAAAILSDNKISGLPVVEAGKLVGIITDTDIFRVFTTLMGARRDGVRATVVIAGVKGTLAQIAAAIAGAGGDILTCSAYQDEQGQWHLTLKVADISREQLRSILLGLHSIVEKIIDLRDSSAIKPS